MSDYRLLEGLFESHRCPAIFGPPRPKFRRHKQGIAYERRVGRELLSLSNKGYIGYLEHNPWFSFTDKCGTGQCCPDFIFQYKGDIVVVEVKHTWVAEAQGKLAELYCPVVGETYNCHTFGLVICRNTIFAAPKAYFTLGEALEKSPHLLHWPMTGRIMW